MPVSGAILGHNRQKHEGSAQFIVIQLTASGNPSLENFFGKICVKPLDSANSKGVGYYSKNWAAHNRSRALKKCLLLCIRRSVRVLQIGFLNKLRRKDLDDHE